MNFINLPLGSVGGFVDSLSHLAGFLFVLLILTFLWVITTLLGKFFSSQAGKKVRQPGLVKAPPLPPDPREPTEEEVAVISAAVFAMFGAQSRVVSIRGGTGDWSREGRREHFASHRLRK